MIVNEAHDEPRHRELTIEVLERLRETGYAYFAAEAFTDRIANHASEGFARLDAGIYVGEPTFGKLVRIAKAPRL